MIDRNDDFDAARGILMGLVLSLGLVAGCALLVQIIAEWVA